MRCIHNIFHGMIIADIGKKSNETETLAIVATH